MVLLPPLEDFLDLHCEEHHFSWVSIFHPTLFCFLHTHYPLLVERCMGHRGSPTTLLLRPLTSSGTPLNILTVSHAQGLLECTRSKLQTNLTYSISNPSLKPPTSSWTPLKNSYFQNPNLIGYGTHHRDLITPAGPSLGEGV